LGEYKTLLAQTPDVEMWSRLLIRYPIHVITQKLTKHRLFSDKSNTSSDRIDVKIRINNEWNLLRENFLLIDSFEKLVATFPSLERFKNVNGYNNKFLLAMVCLYECSDRAAWRLGLTWLFDLLCNPVQADEIAQLYSFTYKDFVKLTGEFDVYALGALAKMSSDIDQTYSKLDAVLADRNAAVADRDAALTERDAALADRDAALADRDAALADRDAAVADREAAAADRNNILNSTFWRITKPLRCFVTFARQLIQTGRYLLLNSPFIFTFARMQKALEFIKIRDVAQLKTDLVIVSRETVKRARRKKIPKPIAPIKLPETQPLVSVVIPCFNYGHFVVDSIDSVLTQTLKNVEIIVVDGGSTDASTIKTLRTIQRPRTTILFRKGRHLVGDNRNYGISKASGRYICCLDADDTVDPTYLEKAVFHLETYGYDIVSTAINFVGDKEGQIDILEFPDLTDMVNGNHVLTCAVFRRQLWESARGFVDFGIGKDYVFEDWDFWVRLAAKGARIRNISGEYLFNYRVHQGGSLSSAAGIKPLSEQKAIILDKNRDLLNPKAFRNSATLQSRYLRCNPCATALAINFNAASSLSLSKKTLLLALPFSIVGGAERLLSGLCIYLTKHNWRIIVVTTLDQDNNYGNSIEWFKKSTSEIYELPRFLDSIERDDFIHYLITSRKPDCLLNAGSLLVYELLPSIRKNYESLCIVDLLFNTVGHVESHMEFKKFITFAMAENHEVYDWYLNVAGWTPDRIRKISSGVDIKRLYPTNRPEELVDKYGITKDEVVIGFSGRLSEEKAPDIFLEVAKLCQGISKLRFVMTGTGPMATEISKQLNFLPPSVKFEFAGLVNDVNQYLALYDVLVLPSRLDGRPLVVMEALACGLPVIASNVGALPDLIEDGKNGLSGARPPMQKNLL
jgi:glycosyltransferase involved in cell wall biosynthesis